LSYLSVVSDLAPDERRLAHGTESAARDSLAPSKRRTSWRGWRGGVAMLVVCLAPLGLLFVRRPGSLMFHLGPHSGFDVGQFLAALPSVAAVAVFAPLVGYRRRDALLMAIPVANIYLAWIVGARAVQLRPGDTPQRWAGSREATRAAVLLTYLAGAVCVGAGIVLSVMSWFAFSSM
jgi:hypothetical protein